MSIVYLWLHDERADRLAEARAEVGLVFFTVVLATGPSGRSSIWGAWWVWWDMRLTLTLFLWFVVAAYLVMRGAIEDDSDARAVLGGARRSRRAADSVHSSERLPVPGALHPMPVVAQAGRAVDVAGDADDVSLVVRRVRVPVHRVAFVRGIAWRAARSLAAQDAASAA